MTSKGNPFTDRYWQVFGMAYQLYWGDLHNHCSVSYGHGTVRQALLRARQQLDFCSITGHAFWPDMPSDRNTYAEIIDYHNLGFARLARNWDRLLAEQAETTVEGEFIALPSYEWHSLQYGDHNVYAPGPELPLRNADDLPALRRVAAESGAIIIPHHIGYAAGYRGIDWRHFYDERSPVVEIFSLHGCSESEHAPYPMLHDMGPRDFGSTAEAGWGAGHRFGVIASTDHHGAYPGSHGDGRLAVLADSLTREGIWDALVNRRVYAATGDKIAVSFTLNDAPIGATLPPQTRHHIRLDVAGWEAVDRVEVLNNGRVIQRLLATPAAASEPGQRYRLRITWGWGRKDQLVAWQAALALSEGTVEQVDTCFAGEAVVAPKPSIDDAETPDEHDLPHELTERGQRHCAWRSLTRGNLTMRHSTTQAISLLIDAPLSARLSLEVNGQRYEHPLGELLRAGRSHYLRGWLSEAVRIGPLTPLAECQLTAAWDEESNPATGQLAEADRPMDIYRVRVAQHNGHWAWLTPIWVER